jgi:hypothetical protein
MSDRLTADPGTPEFLRQLLKIAKESDHPMDKALTRVLSKQIEETEVVRPPSGAQSRQGSSQAEDGSSRWAE